MFIFLSAPPTSSMGWAHSRYSANTGAGATIRGAQPALSPKGLSLCLQAPGKIEMQHHFPPALLTRPSLFSCLEEGGAGEQAKCAELFDSPELYRMLTCSPSRVPELPHITASSCTGVSPVASVLLLLLWEVAEHRSMNPSGVPSSRERRCHGFPLCAGTNLNRGDEEKSFCCGSSRSDLWLLGAV